jgi:hypothetical protein
MKKMLLLLVVPFLFVPGTAFAQPNLDGCWLVSFDYIASDGSGGHEDHYIRINHQGGPLFSAWVMDVCPEDGAYFSGVIDGKDFYLTHWDSLTFGKVVGNGQAITFVNQAFFPDGFGDPYDHNKASETAIGMATRVDDANCDVCE